jgi:L-asparaginase
LAQTFSQQSDAFVGECAGESGEGLSTTIAVLSTGGTIASRQSATGGARASDAGAALLERVTAPAGTTVHVRDLMTVNSFVMTPEDMRAVVVGVRATLQDPGVTGVVVTHGTDTMEETALLVDLFHDDPRPVVFTGAQRAADQEGTDGPANLGDAISVAAASQARGLGVLVVFGGVVLAARGTRKTATVAAAAFTNPETGDLGVVVDGRLRLQGRAPARPRLVPRASSIPSDLPRVDIVALYPGADPVALVALAAAGAHGVVLEATGAGNATPALVEAVRDLVAEGITVVVSTRVHSGPVVALYGGGGGVDLVAAGALLAGTLRPSQARILLIALLGSGASRDQVDQAFRSTARTT